MQASLDRELAVRYGVGLELMKMAESQDNPSLDWSRTMQSLPQEDQIKIAVLLDETTPVAFGISKESQFARRFLRRASRGASEFLGLRPGPVGRSAERAVAEELPEQVLQRGEQAVLGTRPVAAPPGPLPGPEAQLGLFDPRPPRAPVELPVEPIPAGEGFVVQRPRGAESIDYGIQAPTGTLAPAGAPAAAPAAARPVGPMTRWVGETGRKAWEAFQNQGPLQKAMTLFPVGYSAYQMAQGELPTGTGVAGMLLPFVGLGRGWKWWQQIPAEMGALMLGPGVERSLYGWQPRSEQIAQAQQQGFDVGGQQGMTAGLQQGSLMGYQQAAAQMPQMPQIMPVPMMMPQAPMPSPYSMLQPQSVQTDYWGSLATNPSVMARGGPAGLGQAWGQQG